jgi:hypothetical protein
MKYVNSSFLLLILISLIAFFSFWLGKQWLPGSHQLELMVDSNPFSEELKERRRLAGTRILSVTVVGETGRSLYLVVDYEFTREDIPDAIMCALAGRGDNFGPANAWGCRPVRLWHGRDIATAWIELTDSALEVQCSDYIGISVYGRPNSPTILEETFRYEKRWIKHSPFIFTRLKRALMPCP